MVRVPEVQFHEEGGPLQKLECCSHQGKGVPVLNHVIEGTVVKAGSKGPILLADKEEARIGRG